MDGGRIVVRKLIKNGKVNGFEVSNSLAMLGTVVLDVVHVVHVSSGAWDISKDITLMRASMMSVEGGKVTTNNRTIDI